MSRRACVLALTALMLAGCGSPARVTPTAAEEAITARSKLATLALRPVHDRVLWDVRRWDMAADLASARALWVDPERKAVGRWELLYVSPFKRDVALVVEFDGFARMREVRRTGFEWPLGFWHVDADRAVAIATEQGMGSERLMQVTLGHSGGLVWDLHGPKGVWRIDASSGAVLARP